MQTFQDQYTQFQDMSQDQSAESLVIAKRNLNQGQVVLESEIGYPPDEDSRPFTTTTSDIYNLPENFIRLIHLYVTVGTTRYNAEVVWSEEHWQEFKRRSGFTSDCLSHVYVRGRTFEVSPTPATAGNIMTMIYESLSKPLTEANYTTGTITTLAALGTTITASGSAFTAAMVGRYIRIDADGQWYRISAVTNATTLTIATPYQGSAIVAGTAAFTIGQIPRTPPGTHHLPVAYALWRHYEGVRRDPSMANHYKREWEEGLAWAKTVFGNRTATAVIPSQRHLRQRASINPHWYPTLT